MAAPFAKIDCSSSGDNVIVAAVPGKSIRVQNYVLIAGGTVNAKFRSDTTDLMGALPLTAQAGASFSGAGGPAFETAIGAALNLNLSAGVQVSGHLCYLLEG